MARAFASIAAGSGPRLHSTLMELLRLSKLGSSKTLPASAEVSKLTVLLAQQLRAESSTFRSTDVVLIVDACCRLKHCHPPLLEAAAALVLRGAPEYPPYALCHIPNGFARLRYHHKQLLDTIASIVTESSQTDLLSPVDIASLVYAYAKLQHTAGVMLEVCAQRLRACNLKVGAHNCATILNSYARLSECNPELFHAFSLAVLEESKECGRFDVHHVSVIMNAFAKCRIRKEEMMHSLGACLQGRVDSLSPQSVANVVHACAKLAVHVHQLLSELERRVVVEELGAYKLLELTMLTHGLSRLRCGGSEVYKRLFDELAKRGTWEPRDVALILDSMRGKQAFYHNALTRLLLRHLLENLCIYPVHSLTRAAWNLVELDALDAAGSAPPELLTLKDDETVSRCAMRLILERLQELQRLGPLTPAQRRDAQRLARAYHHKYELEYNLQPHHVKAFCRSLFDVPPSVVSSVTRPHRRWSA